MTKKHLCLAVAVVFGLSGSLCFAQGAAFTYQGRLNDGATPANGTYDFRLLLYDSASGGGVIAGPATNAAVTVTNGLFMMVVDFGSGVFTGGSNWLHLGVRTNGSGSFNALSPRQQLTPAPYAIFAEGANAAGLVGTIPTGDLSGTYGSPITLNNAGNSFSGDGSGLVNVNAGLLGGLASSNFWKTTGNAGTVAGVNFVGTTDNQPLDLDTYGVRGLHLEYTSRFTGYPFFYSQAGVNVIGGFWGNTISNTVIGGTIAGGGDSAGSFLYTSYGNTVSGDFGSVGGGYANNAGYASAIPGGYYNTATGNGSFAGGRLAQVTYAGSFIWNDGTRTNYSNGANRFDIFASGGLNVQDSSLPSGTIHVGSYATGGDPKIVQFGDGDYVHVGESGADDRMELKAGTFFFTHDGIENGYVGINTSSPQQQLDVNGRFMVVEGLGGEMAYIGGDGAGGDVQIGSLKSGITAVAAYNATDNAYMHFYCSSITIEGGADLAEPFQISGVEQEIAQGSVVVIDELNPGKLKLSDRPYDSRVAGVVSGANGINPGIQMQQQGLLEGGKNVALTGRVYVRADATNGAIHPGDLLTTSSVPGRAMKVTDHAKASGAILGKAMTGLSEGDGMVLVLVTLQ